MALLIGLLCCSQAFAIVFPHTYKVGPKPACDFTTIQEAIDAASATAGDTIALDANLSYPGQHLDTKGKALTFTANAVCTIGGAPHAATAGTQAVISGDLNASTPVFKITGAVNVTLVDLKITGNHSSGDGGGIVYLGSATLTLTNVLVTGNTANRGAGILFDGAGGSTAQLVLGTDSQVIGNTAQISGGGIRVQGNGKLVASSPGNWIAFNHAPNGYGGGIELYGGNATLNSPGVAGNPLVYINDANYGGGIAIEGVSDFDSILNVGAVNAKYPVRIEGNSATLNGGGIYLIPYDSSFHGVAQMNANRYRIDLNTASEGSAIFGDCTTIDFTPCVAGSRLYLNNVSCSPGVDCNTIDGNENEDSLATPTDGATIRLKAGYVDAHGVHMRLNRGGHVLSSTDSGSFSFKNSLLAENQVTKELIKADSIYLSQCTLANDSILAAYTINHTADGNLSLRNLVFGEDGTAALQGSTSNSTIQNIVAVDAVGLPSALDIIQANPLFFDIAHSDYRLRVQTDGVTSKDSPAVDFAITDASDEPSDIDGRARVQDVPFLVDRFGPVDLGAYEMQPITDRIFVGTFGDPYQLVY